MKNPAAFVDIMAGRSRNRSLGLSPLDTPTQVPWDSILSEPFRSEPLSTPSAIYHHLLVADAETYSTAATAATTFDPVLNVPALGTFVFIAVVFGGLRWRVGQIEDAARQRTLDLQNLRQAKAAELEGDTHDAKQRALEVYRASVEKVEDLRTVIPGVKISTPSTSLSSSRLAKENALAAKQFLGIDLDYREEEDSGGPVPPAPSIKDSSNDSIPLPLMAVLGVVVASQLGLLTLFLQDPLAMSSSPF